ncbi:MAG: ADP-ribosylglycohydrolase family protein [Candidatus Nanoarchaeia archaeon]
MKIDKSLGCIYGLAIGDALGYPVEFFKNDEIKIKYEEKGVTDFTRTPALYSDDTQMSIAVANALISSANAQKLNDLEYVMTEVSKEFVNWYKSPENTRAPGNACLSGCFRLKNGISWRESGNPNSKGCGSAMRTAPVGLVYCNDMENLRKVALATAQATHRHPTALAGAVGTAYLVASALKDTNPECMADRLLDLTALISDEFAQKIMQVKKVLTLGPEKAFDVLGGGWVAEEAVAGALYCFLRNPRDYSNAVLTAVNFSGDRDSVACITGAISGSYNGISAIPKKWVNGIENSALLEDIAKKLCRNNER